MPLRSVEPVSEPDAIDDAARQDARPVLDPATVEADRRDLRRGLLVAAAGLIAVAVIGGLMNLGAFSAAERPEKAVDADTSEVQLPTFPLPEEGSAP